MYITVYFVYFQIGIHELGLRKSILKNAESFRTSKRASVQKETEASPSHVNMNKFKNTVTNTL